MSLSLLNVGFLSLLLFIHAWVYGEAANMQQTSEFSLAATYQQALQHNPELAIQRYRIQAQQASNDGVRSLVLPQVDLRFGLYRNHYQSNDPVLNYQGDAFDDVSTCQGDANPSNCLLNVLDGVSYSNQDSHFSSQELRLSIVQPIYDAQRFRALDGAKAHQQSLALQEVQAEQQLMVDLIQQFFALLLTQDEVQISAQQWAAQQQLLKQHQALMASGALSEALYFDSQLTLGRLDMVQLNAKAAFMTQLEKWQQLSPGTARQFDASKPWRVLANQVLAKLLPNDKSLQYWQQQARQHNLNSLRLNYLQEQAVQAWRQAKSGHYPTVNLAAFYANRELVGGEGFIPGSEEAAIGLDVSIPIYHGGRTSSKVTEMALKKVAAEDENQLFLSHLDRQVNTLYQQILRNKQQLVVFEQMLVNAEKSKRLVIAKVRSGEQPLEAAYEVENRQKNLALEQRRLSYQLVLDTVTFKKMIGHLSVADLQSIDECIQFNGDVASKHNKHERL